MYMYIGYVYVYVYVYVGCRRTPAERAERSRERGVHAHAYAEGGCACTCTCRARVCMLMHTPREGVHAHAHAEGGCACSCTRRGRVCMHMHMPRRRRRGDGRGMGSTGRGDEYAGRGSQQREGTHVEDDRTALPIHPDGLWRRKWGQHLVGLSRPTIESNRRSRSLGRLRRWLRGGRRHQLAAGHSLLQSLQLFFELGNPHLLAQILEFLFERRQPFVGRILGHADSHNLQLGEKRVEARRRLSAQRRQRERVEERCTHENDEHGCEHIGPHRQM